MAEADAIPRYATDHAQIYSLHELKAFDAEKKVRRKLFKTGQLWTEMVCYDPGQATVMHKHPLEEEFIYIVEGTANMNIAGDEVQLSAGELAKFPANTLHDVRNLQETPLVIMFTKSPQKLKRKGG